MQGLPSFLASGDWARLIPVVADSSKENRAASVLLSNIVNVEALAKSLLGSIGQRVSTRTSLEAFTEVVFKNTPENTKIRPDGLLILKTGNRSWSALIEAKIGRSTLDEEQIAKYCRLAKANQIDAVITLSNQFSALPTHHPVKLSKGATRGIELYHWSWMHILTQAKLIWLDHDFESQEQRYLLGEMVRYFEHDSVGISRFEQMNQEWKGLVLKVHSGGMLNRSSPEVQNSVAAWHQEQRDLCLSLSRKLGRHVTLKLPRAHGDDQLRRLKDDCDELVKSQALECVLEVPDAAAPINVKADVEKRTVTCSMSLIAPREKKRARSRINWLLQQLKKSDPDNIFIRAKWRGRAPETYATLAELRENPTKLMGDNASVSLQAFEVSMVCDLAGRFSGSRTFIEDLETTVPNYYEQIGQHVRAWVPQPPTLPKEGNDGGQGSRGNVAGEARPETVVKKPEPISSFRWPFSS